MPLPTHKGFASLVVTVVIYTWFTAREQPTTPRKAAPKHTQPQRNTPILVYF